MLYNNKSIQLLWILYCTAMAKATTIIPSNSLEKYCVWQQTENMNERRMENKPELFWKLCFFCYRYTMFAAARIVLYISHVAWRAHKYFYHMNWKFRPGALDWYHIAFIFENVVLTLLRLFAIATLILLMCTVHTKDYAIPINPN